jgi:anti-anti-sigma regulatory factor
MDGAVTLLDPILRIDGRQTIEAADALLVDLRRLIEGKVDPVVDLDGLLDCSIATLQLICSAAITAASAGLNLRLTSVRQELLSSIQAMGLHHAAPFHGLMEDGETIVQGSVRAHHAS